MLQMHRYNIHLPAAASVTQETVVTMVTKRAFEANAPSERGYLTFYTTRTSIVQNIKGNMSGIDLLCLLPGQRDWGYVCL